MGGEVGAEERKGKQILELLKDPLSMILVQVLTTGMFLLSKAVLNKGHSVFAILTYRCIVGALFVLPFALYIERGKWKELNWMVVFWIFLNALMGITGAMGFYYYGLCDTNATYAASFLNLVPVLTFLFAVVVRLERLGFDSRGGRIKILGTILCVGGAMVISMYNGATIHITSPKWETNTVKKGFDASSNHKVRGTLFLIASCLCFSTWVIVQAKLLQRYPFKYCATMYTCVAASLQSAVLGLILNASRSKWILRWNLELLLVVYSGALNTGAVFCLISWVVPRKGPSYATMFNALSLILTTILEAVFMTGDFTVGSLIGITMIIGGLYAYLWGRGHQLPSKQIRDEESIIEVSTSQRVEEDVYCSQEIENLSVQYQNPR
ncbi:WAT1-related protein At1g43650-like isoform X1 [Dendrobium catenatum]|uniref:WAT1-related protein n=1 Tax=Dendrobium catenatum TaxID=906689 RepID=A0A2I0X1C5_9ASPA|nr:WAT1-related protein At1g43650-like isoform X1 [Dendrobium catenatum]PKU81715.1 Protein WALLS ARE THIN 1 [Dendrobium catenatum]